MRRGEGRDAGDVRGEHGPTVRPPATPGIRGGGQAACSPAAACGRPRPWSARIRRRTARATGQASPRARVVARERTSSGPSAAANTNGRRTAGRPAPASSRASWRSCSRARTQASRVCVGDGEQAHVARRRGGGRHALGLPVGEAVGQDGVGDDDVRGPVRDAGDRTEELERLGDDRVLRRGPRPRGRSAPGRPGRPRPRPPARRSAPRRRPTRTCAAPAGARGRARSRARPPPRAAAAGRPAAPSRGPTPCRRSAARAPPVRRRRSTRTPRSASAGRRPGARRCGRPTRRARARGRSPPS